MPKDSKKWRVYLSLIFLLVLADQFSKTFFLNWLEFSKTSWIFTLTKNTGTFFGLLKNGNIFFALITLAVIAGILIYFNKIEDKYKLPFVLVLAGGLGNLIDRLFFGGVIDFIDLKIWPIFNLADSFITIGILWLIWLAFIKK